VHDPHHPRNCFARFVVVPYSGRYLRWRDIPDMKSCAKLLHAGGYHVRAAYSSFPDCSPGLRPMSIHILSQFHNVEPFPLLAHLLNPGAHANALIDPDFEEKDTLEAQTDWTKSTLHAFLRGARPSDPESQREANQVRTKHHVFSPRNTLTPPDIDSPKRRTDPRP
jgi:hypothetical protein